MSDDETHRLASEALFSAQRAEGKAEKAEAAAMASAELTKTVSNQLGTITASIEYLRADNLTQHRENAAKVEIGLRDVHARISTVAANQVVDRESAVARYHELQLAIAHDRGAVDNKLLLARNEGAADLRKLEDTSLNRWIEVGKTIIKYALIVAGSILLAKLGFKNVNWLQ